MQCVVRASKYRTGFTAAAAAASSASDSIWNHSLTQTRFTTQQSSASLFSSTLPLHRSFSAPSGSNSTSSIPQPSQSSWKKIEWKDQERREKAQEKRKNLYVKEKHQTCTVVDGYNVWVHAMGANNLSGRNVSELYNSAGKPYTTPAQLVNIGIAHRIPPAALTANTLSGQAVSLPEDCPNFAATFLIVGFNQQAYDFGEKWMDEFVSKYPQDGTQSKVKALQVSIISNSLIGALFGNYMDRRMQSTLPPPKHRYVCMLKNNVFDHQKLKSTYVKEDEDEKRRQALAAQQAAANDPNAPVPTRPRRSAIDAEPGWSIQNPMLAHLFLLDRGGRIRWRAVGPPQGEDLQVLFSCVDQLMVEGTPQVQPHQRRR